MGIHIIRVSNHKGEFTSLPWYHFQQEQVLAHSFSSSFKRTVQYIATNTPSAVFASKILHFQEFLLYELCMDSSSVTCWSHSVCRVTIQKRCLYFSRFGDLVKCLIRFLCFLVTSSLGISGRGHCAPLHQAQDGLWLSPVTLHCCMNHLCFVSDVSKASSLGAEEAAAGESNKGAKTLGLVLSLVCANPYLTKSDAPSSWFRRPQLQKTSHLPKSCQLVQLSTLLSWAVFCSGLYLDQADLPKVEADIYWKIICKWTNKLR